MTATSSAARHHVAQSPHLPDSLRRQWAMLATPDGPAEPFSPDMVNRLPVAAQRWLRHAIAPGTPLRRRAELAQHGQIRLGAWRRFEATQVLAPPHGYIWAVTAHVMGLPTYGYDRLSGGTGELRHRLLGRVPVVTTSGPDVTRSAAARLASELVWAPAAALAPAIAWEHLGRSQVLARIPVAGQVVEVTITVSEDGGVSSVVAPRWASVDGEPYRVHLFGADLADERTFDGITVPTSVVAGYGYGGEDWPGCAFIRQRVDDIVFL